MVGQSGANRPPVPTTGTKGWATDTAWAKKAPLLQPRFISRALETGATLVLAPVRNRKLSHHFPSRLFRRDGNGRTEELTSPSRVRAQEPGATPVGGGAKLRAVGRRDTRRTVGDMPIIETSFQIS